MSVAQDGGCRIGSRRPGTPCPRRRSRRSSGSIPSRGLDAAEAAERLKTYGPNRLPQGKKKGPLMRFLAQFNNILVYVLLDRRLHQADAEPVARRLDHLRGRHPQFAARLPAGGPGGEGAQLDPQHAVGGGARRSRRRDAAHSRRGSGARRHRPSRVRRQDPGRLASRRRQEPAHRGGGADRRVRPGGEDDRSGRRQGDGRRPREHGLLRHHGRVGPRDRRRGRDRQPDGTRPHQPDARRGQRARDAAPAPDQEVRLRHHRRHRRRQRAALLLGPLARAYDLRRAVPGGGRHRGVADPGGPAGADHDHARHRRAAHGAAATRSSAACRRSRRSAPSRASAPTRPAR